MFEGDIKEFDKFFLVVKLKNEKIVSIPWQEVKHIKHTTTPSSWLEETYMTKEDVEVKTLVTPLSQTVALQRAIFPGFLKHGEGHFYAKSKDTAMSLLSAEILSIAIMAVSINEILTSPYTNQSYDVSKIVFFTGLTIFVGSWLYDIIFAPRKVEEFNKTHKFLLNDNKNDNKEGEQK